MYFTCSLMYPYALACECMRECFCADAAWAAEVHPAHQFVSRLHQQWWRKALYWFSAPFTLCVPPQGLYNMYYCDILPGCVTSYEVLTRHYGDPHWKPCEGEPDEVITFSSSRLAINITSIIFYLTRTKTSILNHLCHILPNCLFPSGVPVQLMIKVKRNIQNSYETLTKQYQLTTGT